MKKQIVIFRIIFFAVATFLVVYFFPRNDAFRYEYEVGKPWRYGLLTAPYDLPIYRADSIIASMQDSVKQRLEPRFVLNSNVGAVQLAKLDDANRRSKRFTAREYEDLRSSLAELYQTGILGMTDKDSLLNHNYEKIWIQTSANRMRQVPLRDVCNAREAYEKILTDAAKNGVSVSTLKNFDVSLFLISNLDLDSVATRRAYNELMQSISQTSGIVIAGTRIVDRGEIVTPQVFDILNSLKKAQLKRRSFGGDEVIMVFGQWFIIALLFGAMLFFLHKFRPWILSSMHETQVAVFMIVLMVILTAMGSAQLVQGAYLVPVGIVTIVLSTFHGARTAFFCHVIMSLLCSFLASSQYEYLFVQLMIGMVIVFSLKDGLTERSQLMRVAIFSFLGYCFFYCIFTLANEGTLTGISWFSFVLFLANSLMLLLTYLIIFALEKVFGFMSGVTLVELCNLNAGLLARLSEECPGTFQHSMQVSNLTAYAAKKIGANAQLVRTGALYHDIGKLWNPSYYTENQHGMNPHDNLTTEKSVEYIKRHVSEGVTLAEKAKLPKEIIAFIKTHHGCGQIKYFYNTWCNAHPDEKPDEKLFSYEGPDPVTREQALLMMGDSVEAASKSLKDYSEESLRKLVNGIIDSLVSSGRLKHSKISFYDVEEVKQAFIDYLLSMYHTRISYPTLNNSRNRK